jgi:hypothetical protein
MLKTDININLKFQTEDDFLFWTHLVEITYKS